MASRRDLERRFTALLATHGGALRRLAAGYTRDAGGRDDLFQEMAVAIWRALPSFRGECMERTFVFRIAHNRGISHMARRPPIAADLDEEASILDTRPNPETALTTGQQHQRLLAAVQRLPLAYRQVIVLALEGSSYTEIADVVGISETNVGARLTRARQMLRTLLQER